MEKLKINGGYPLHTFSQLKERYESYITLPNERLAIEKAYEFVLKAHDGQIRRSGEPYVHHLIEVAYILAKLNADVDTIVSGLLHDVVEDTDVPITYIEENWGPSVAKIVDALTKIQRMKLSKRTEADFAAEDHQKIFLGMAKDIRVIYVKLADRLHNMRTLDALSPERQIALSQETLDVYAPIAHTLGAYRLKGELEDLCLKYLKPDIYEEIEMFLSKRIKKREKSLDSLKKKLTDLMFAKKIPCRIEARVKSIYSLYKKIYIKGHHIDEIYDILALRIVTQTEETTENCYAAFGLIQTNFQTVPDRLKDYIASPKPNGYKSIHTTIIFGDGNIYEIQIRNEKMDQEAENGIAAHWIYKNVEKNDMLSQLSLQRDLERISENGNGDAKEYVDTVTHEIFGDTVTVLSPKGKAIVLPKGSTPIDFAYRIHTKVGDTATGALINGAMVPLNTELQSGDVIEIKTSKSSTPNAGWLKFVKTTNARENIKKYIQQKTREDSRFEFIEKGRMTLINGLMEFGLTSEQVLQKIDTPHILNRFNVEKIDSLYFLVYNKTVSVSAVANTLGLKKEKVIRSIKFDESSINSTNPVLVSGAHDIKTTLAKCCRPIPGDDIIGFVSKGRGMSIHRIDCPNINSSSTTRLFHDVRWNPRVESSLYPVDLKIVANDRDKLLTDILGLLSSHKIPVTNAKASLNYDLMISTFRITIAVRDASHLKDVINALINVQSVYEITREIH